MSTKEGLKIATLSVPISLITAAYNKNSDLYEIDPEEAKKQNIPRPLSIKPKTAFDPNQSVMCESNFQIDKAIKLKTPPDSMVMIKTNWFKMVDAPFEVKPIAAYMNYIDSFTVPGTQENTLTKKNGYSSRLVVSAEIKAGASAGIYGCNASLEVTTGFSYEQTITSEITETWKQTLPSGSYVVYQNCLLYAYKFHCREGAIFSDKLFMARYAAQGVKWYSRDDGYFYFFVPVFRNDPFTLKYSDQLYDPVPYDTVIAYVSESGFEKWQ